MNIHTSRAEYLESELHRAHQMHRELMAALDQAGLYAVRTQNGIEIHPKKAPA